MYGNNFFNPFTYQPSYQTTNLARGLTRSSLLTNTALGNTNTIGLKSLLGKFSFSGFLNGASKTLNFINQAIPVFYQVKPIINNAKTMFRVIGAIRDDKPTTKTSQNIFSNVKEPKTNNTNTKIQTNISNTYNNFEEENPTFFI